ncbi:MAG: DUF1223 domain-containing protein [Burkholderiaceae bacterium]|nr:DUF1223 domain-containing protein [Sulfuritalea sp.]MCF8175254.1 DUF1223 domain-containing protein [Burkholderiaceae bacterium]
MSMPPFARLLASCLCALFSAGVLAAPSCVAQSGPQRAVLLELYTSEGCSSCPPADRRLSQFKSQAEYAGRVVPLAFHVDYWDRLGWVDRFASPAHTRRQYAMASAANSRLVYTPQFLRNGQDWRGGGNPLDGVEGKTAGASIALTLGASGATSLAVGGKVDLDGSNAEVYLALYENNLESQVRDGENAGKALRHDYVVRRLIGPLAPDPAGRVILDREIKLAADWKPADLGVVAFVQNPASGEILQALQRHACAS